MIDTPIAREACDALRRHARATHPALHGRDPAGSSLISTIGGVRPGRRTSHSSTPARTTIAFAQIDRAMPGQGYDRYVRHGCAFLQQAMWDPEQGGFFARVNRSGSPDRMD